MRVIPPGATHAARGRRHGPRRVAIALVVVTALVTGVAGYVWTRPARVPANTFVAGVAVGGLDAAGLRTALETRVRPRVEITLEVTAGADRFELGPTDLGIRLDVGATARAVLATATVRDRLPWRAQARHDIPATFTMDPAVVETTLDQRLADAQHSPRSASVELPTPAVVLEAQGDASFRPRAARAVVHAGRAGQTVDRAAAVAAIRAAVAAGRRDVTVPVRLVQPATSAADLTGVDQLIGSFTTHHACCEPRVTNIHRIAEIIDGTVVLPGATFSLNQAAGRRTPANGFVAAPAISDGELVQQYGGGVSQFSTTLFNATWFSGLPSLKHQPHSKYISRYPPGREATLDYDTIDQVFRNDTDTPVVIRTATTGTSLTVALYGHTGDREVTSVTAPRLPRNGGGFSISVQRQVHQGGALTGTDTVRWTYTGFD